MGHLNSVQWVSMGTLWVVTTGYYHTDNNYQWKDLAICTYNLKGGGGEDWREMLNRHPAIHKQDKRQMFTGVNMRSIKT